jgi:hypothetical protein
MNVEGDELSRKNAMDFYAKRESGPKGLKEFHLA